MSKIFGGSKSKSQQTASSSSSNQAYQPIQQAYMPGATAAFQAGTGALQEELAGGYDAYKENTGLDFWEQIGLRKTAGGFSGRGLYNSGATMKGLSNFSNGLRTASYNDYLQQQTGLANLGLQGGGLVSGAGNISNSQSQGTAMSKSNKGIGETLAAAASIAAASDERLKKDITKISEHAGLGVYQYTYINDAGPYIGVMAQEVKNLYPEALGPEVSGYLTVDYGKLQELTGEIKYG